jgi:serine/threonine-protein kinase 24/25/MST4
MVGGAGTMKSEWNFDETIRGTIKGVSVELALSMEDDGGEWDVEDDEEEEDAWGTTRVNDGHDGVVRINVSANLLLSGGLLRSS